MSATSDTPAGDRKTGKVVRILGDYGFVACDDVPDQDLYFKSSWFRGNPPLQEGDVVSFTFKQFGTNSQAHYLTRPADDPSQRSPGQVRARNRLPTSKRLFDWAYMGYLPNTLAELAGLVLPGERWEFQNTPRDPERPSPILYSYLLHTFGRLVREGNKILVNESASLAAFNTGLVDPRYENIYALFVPNYDSRAPWQLAGFCIAGEGADGQNLVRHFAPLPAAAHYFDEPVQLLYDVRAGKPELDWKHVIIERIDRYPKEFLEDHWPSGFERKDVSSLTDDQRREYYVGLGNAIEHDSRLYRRIMNRVRDAVDLSIKRVSWNFKTAVPQYYPRVERLQLLLPICLVSDETVDIALAVEITDSGNYLAHTVLPLDWAYTNARLICRPNSDWLTPDRINEGIAAEEEA